MVTRDAPNPTLKMKHGLAREDRCPDLIEQLKVIADYEMTIGENNIIDQNGDD